MYDCPLCSRKDLPVLSDHHLTPKSRGGKITLPICQDCHRSIHAFFTNKELEDTYHTVEALLSHEKFAKHIKWLSKRDPSLRYKTKWTVEKRRYGRG